MNDAFGEPEELPFDLRQHRWPISYRFTEQTQVAAKRLDSLTESLATAISDCQAHSLVRAREMAESLDTSTLQMVARNEHNQAFEIPLPSVQVGQLLVGLDFNMSIRRLMDLGAVRVTDTPHLRYTWTFDGRRMIDELNRMHPLLLDLVRNRMPKD